MKRKSETNRIHSLETTGGTGWVILALPSFHRLNLNISVVRDNTFNNKQLNKNTNSLLKSFLH